VPLTLARMARRRDYAVVEIGMNHPGEIAPSRSRPGPTSPS
jgi:UDP-N-acetylmuramoyl-tripeptide--D-alanyl-D-alanine ligase